MAQALKPVVSSGGQHKPGNKLREDEALYNRLCSSSSLAFVQFFYCKRDLEPEMGQDPVKHDFLWLELRNENATKHFILAEKHHDGIHIEWRHEAPQHKYRVETLDCECSFVGLQPNIEDVLEAFQDKYDLFTSNCKHYARTVGKNLIDALPISEEHKQREKMKIDRIPL